MTETITMPSGVTSYVRDAGDATGMYLVVNGIKYDVRYCGDVALYYLNAYGGWDAFLIEGNVVKSDNKTHYEYDKFARNTTIDFETTRYATEIETTYKLSTGWLKDDQAERLCKHLLSSNMVYMHILDENKIVPVNIKDTKVEYKTYKATKKMINYTIEVVLSKNKMRR